MLLMWLNLLVLLVMVCSTILCLKSELIALRRSSQSSTQSYHDMSYDLSEFISPKLFKFVKKKHLHQHNKRQHHHHHQHQKHQQQQQQQQKTQTQQQQHFIKLPMNEEEIDERITEIFFVGKPFNTATKLRMYGDTPSSEVHKVTSNSNGHLPFIVRRNWDGKLNIVYNETLSLQRLATSNSGNRTPNPNTSVVYPGPKAETTTTTHPPRNNSLCLKKIDGETLCDKARDYPDLSNFKNELNKYSSYFNNVEEPLEITQRMDSGTRYLCSSNETMYYPQIAETRNASWRYIVNDEYFKQGIRVEMCTGPPNAPCEFTESFPNSYQPKCTQRYVYRPLIGLDENNKPNRIDFRIPSCCKCVIYVH